ncbi:MAG: hypothetical protein KDK66_03290 [Deltaproteobacteria bacterium]|nr:hypothetical protein [Deltaproteobacteria bacterium]
MQATTIKVEGVLLKNLKKIIPSRQSISSFVRDILTKEVERHQLIKGAEAYADFLKKHPEEEAWLEDWEKADLLSAPKPKKRRLKKRKN